MKRWIDLLSDHLLPTTTISMAFQGTFLLFLVLTFSTLFLDAFLPDPAAARRRQNFLRQQQQQQQQHLIKHCERDTFVWSSSSHQLASSNDQNDENGDNSVIPKQQQPSLLTHADILWKVRPAQDTTSLWQRLWLRLAANLIRLDCIVFRKEPPTVLCPKGGQAVLEAHCYDDGNHHHRLVKVGRFGFTTERGPSAPAIQESVRDLYGIDATVGVGAIIYMFVEPSHRQRHVGALALEVISLIQALQGCDVTVLVVDDDGSGKLVEWYAQNGYALAPKLQDLLGSPNGKHGVTMIAPTRNILPKNCHIQWW